MVVNPYQHQVFRSSVNSVPLSQNPNSWEIQITNFEKENSYPYKDLNTQNNPPPSQFQWPPGQEGGERKIWAVKEETKAQGEEGTERKGHESGRPQPSRPRGTTHPAPVTVWHCASASGGNSAGTWWGAQDKEKPRSTRDTAKLSKDVTVDPTLPSSSLW